MTNYEVIERYGVRLKRLTIDKIELVRRWRNDPKISQYMDYREYITPEQQLAWFHSINNDNNYYFIIEVDGKEIGLTNVKDIDYEKGTGEPGIFIWDDNYLNGPYSFKASICLTDFIFETLKLKEVRGHVLANNRRALRYNKFLGYKLAEGQEGLDLQLYTLSYSDYQEARKQIIKYLI